MLPKNDTMLRRELDKKIIVDNLKDKKKTRGGKKPDWAQAQLVLTNLRLRPVPDVNVVAALMTWIKDLERLEA